MEREPDDYHPRAQLKKLHKESRISSDDSDAVKRFSQSYVVDENEVLNYLHHLQHLVLMSEKRKLEKQAKNARENEMTCDEFDWLKMLKDGTLSKQRLDVLNKYIDKHKLAVTKTSKKQNKVEAIDLHGKAG
jgi:ATP adenylyltransferase/5',5'''-P-1,P-4-tetraphosphate phosphorylase II